MDKKIIGVIAVLLLIIGGILMQPVMVNVNPIGVEVKPADVQIITSGETLGAIPGTEISSNEFTVGGVTEYRVTQKFTGATTTPCPIKSPAYYSQLVSYSVATFTSTSTAGEFQIGTSTTAYATSSSMLTVAVAANTAATSTWVGSSNTNIIAPSTYVNIGVSGAGTLIGNYTYPNAYCSAVFRKI